MPFLTAKQARTKARQAQKDKEAFILEKCNDLAVKIEVSIDSAAEKGEFEAVTQISLDDVKLLGPYLYHNILDVLTDKGYDVTFLSARQDYKSDGYDSPTIVVNFEHLDDEDDEEDDENENENENDERESKERDKREKDSEEENIANGFRRGFVAQIFNHGLTAATNCDQP